MPTSAQMPASYSAAGKGVTPTALSRTNAPGPITIRETLVQTRKAAIAATAGGMRLGYYERDRKRKGCRTDRSLRYSFQRVACATGRGSGSKAEEAVMTTRTRSLATVKDGSAGHGSRGLLAA